MRNLFKLTFLFFCAFLLSTNITYAKDTGELEKQLSDLGIAEEYTNNIAEYVNNIDITDDEYNSIISDGEAVITMVNGKNSITDFSLNELYNVYGNIRSIMKQLNLSMKIDVKNRQFAIVDKATNSVLYKGNPKDIDDYYANYEELLDNGEEALNLEEYIKDLIDSRNSTHNESVIVNEDKESDDYQENNNITPKRSIEVKETEANEDIVAAEKKSESSDEIEVNEEDIINPIEEDIENNKRSIEEVKSTENQYDTTLAMSKGLSDKIIYYILGGAMLALVVISGILKFL